MFAVSTLKPFCSSPSTLFTILLHHSDDHGGQRGKVRQVMLSMYSDAA
jgi:hypothetical protein